MCLLEERHITSCVHLPTPVRLNTPVSVVWPTAGSSKILSFDGFTKLMMCVVRTKNGSLDMIRVFFSTSTQGCFEVVRCRSRPSLLRVATVLTQCPAAATERLCGQG